MIQEILAKIQGFFVSLTLQLKGHRAPLHRNAFGGWIIGIQLEEYLIVYQKKKGAPILINYGTENYHIDSFNLIVEESSQQPIGINSHAVSISDLNSTYQFVQRGEYLCVKDQDGCTVTTAKIDYSTEGVGIILTDLTNPILLACIFTRIVSSTSLMNFDTGEKVR